MEMAGIGIGALQGLPAAIVGTPLAAAAWIAMALGCMLGRIKIAEI
jgi:2-keto-4-pentenoate hydratase